MELDFIVDKITESIERAATGERLETRVEPILTAADLKVVTKRNRWRFDWERELSLTNRQVFKLVAVEEPDIVQGLVSLSVRENDKIVVMPLIENAPSNIGKDKIYEGVCGNMVAYGCFLSKEHGFGGYLSFEAKTTLIEHYKKTLGATHYGGLKMGIEPQDAEWLINKYYYYLEKEVDNAPISGT